LENVGVDIARVKIGVNFEVITIVVEKDIYPALLRIEWTYENYEIINLKSKNVF
jgi:hypothetical protein